MCHIFESELKSTTLELFEDKAKKEIMKKIRLVIDKIVAQAQKGVVLLGLSSANTYASPKKDGERFTDMHE